MTDAIVTWLIGIVGGWIGNALAHFFSGACPFGAQTWICVNWETIATVAGVILLPFGYTVTVRKLAERKASTSASALRLVPPPPPEPDPVQTYDPGASGDADPHSGP